MAKAENQGRAFRKARRKELHLKIKLYTGKKQIGLGLFHSKVIMRQNSDGYIYFDTKPDHLYEIADYKWKPRYKTISRGSTVTLGGGSLRGRSHLSAFGGTSGASSAVTSDKELKSIAMLTLRDVTDDNKKVVIGIKCNTRINLKIHEFRFASEEKATADHQLQAEEQNVTLLKQYKDLLDSGVISEEEFQAKKTQLLNK